MSTKAWGETPCPALNIWLQPMGKRITIARDIEVFKNSYGIKSFWRSNYTSHSRAPSQADNRPAACRCWFSLTDNCLSLGLQDETARS